MSTGCCPDRESSQEASQQDTQDESCCELHPPTRPGPARCPVCGELGKPVERLTLGALAKPDRRGKIPSSNQFYLCRRATCEVVYFLPGKVLFWKNDLAVRVWVKEPDDLTVPVCYCFGWTPERIRTEVRETGKSTVIDQIKAQVKAGNCYCEVTNPEGSCCLGNVGKLLKEMTKLLGGGF